jgi:hypothetical protein
VTLRLVLPGPGRAELVEEPDAELADGQVRIATAFTGLSAGTELSWYKGSNPFLGRHFDAELGVFSPGEPASPYPVTRVGYMETGTVVESRSAALPAGTRVAAPYGHATGHVADPATEHVVPLPDSTRSSACTSRTWARSAPTACCTLPLTPPAGRCGRWPTGSPGGGCWSSAPVWSGC